MKNTYELEVQAMCPVDKTKKDVYQVIITSERTIQVETILRHFLQYEDKQIFQEDMAYETSVALGAHVTIEGTHSGVYVCSVAP